jgi:hypothetical protein
MILTKSKLSRHSYRLARAILREYFGPGKENPGPDPWTQMIPLPTKTDPNRRIRVEDYIDLDFPFPGLSLDARRRERTDDKMRSLFERAQANYGSFDTRLFQLLQEIIKAPLPDLSAYDLPVFPDDWPIAKGV